MKIPEPKKLPSGSWTVRVMVDGHRISITKPTKKACIAEAAALKTGIKKQRLAPDGITLEQAYKKHIEKNEANVLPLLQEAVNRHCECYGVTEFIHNGATEKIIQKWHDLVKDREL